MTIKEEFEKAFEKEVKENGYDSVENDPQMGHLLQKGKLALWAAKWMLKKVAKLWEQGKFTTDELVKMLKEFS